MSSKVETYQAMARIIEKQFKEFTGDMGQFESAIGALIIGQLLGWRVLLLVHDRRTIALYEKILGVDFRDGKTMPDEGKFAKKSIARIACQKVSNFWKAVKGEIPGIKTKELKKI